MAPRLRPDSRFFLEYADETDFGGLLSTKLIGSLAKAYSNIHELIRTCGPIYVVEHSQELLEESTKQPFYEKLLEGANSKTIKTEILYPEKSLIRPTALHIICTNDKQRFRLEFQTELMPIVHDIIAILCGSNSTNRIPDDMYHNKILSELRNNNMLISEDSQIFVHEKRNQTTWQNCDITFIGHATVLVRSKTTKIIIDPWFFPAGKDDPVDYHPITKSEIGHVDAILITHSHPDHFVPGTLIQFDKKTKVIVPRVEKESLLSLDMAYRLKQLGFEDVLVMDWWDEKWIGDIQTISLPFYGEQPTTSDQLYPNIRMKGNTYLVRTPKISCAFIADSGSDRTGDVRHMALEAYRRWGRIDILFTGYRGWYLYPIQYLKSSVPSYLLFIPPDLYKVRQSIMNGRSEAVDTAEMWHANYIVPYADGGAPWYSAIGLGPDLLASKDDVSTERPFFDPLAESCLEELSQRSAIPPDLMISSKVLPLLLRPGQSVRMFDTTPQIVDSDFHNGTWFDKK